MSVKVRRIRKWLKWFFITIGSFLGLIIILAIVYNQLTFRLLLGLGSMDMYNGNNERGNEIMTYAFSHIENPGGETFHAMSVQNTKNGNYNIAIEALEKAVKLEPEDGSAYYGWVLLYYYRDYEKALSVLEQCDAYTPGFSDAPMGDDIHYLKGLCHFQMKHYQTALDEFDIYINNMARTHGEGFVNVYTFIQKGRCLKALGRFDESILSYKKAIKYYKKCTEAYYFMGLTQLEMNEKDSACLNFNFALDLIKKGHKSSDTYVEYFHEIYTLEIERSISESCEK
tara:strand:+ start:12830 stop:13681 length:852 start_codon:yes stop_codon:yes gene_type:complete